MKSPRDRAIDIAHEAIGGPSLMSRQMYVQFLGDDSGIGQSARKLVSAIEAGITADRLEIEKSRAPS